MGIEFASDGTVLDLESDVCGTVHIYGKNNTFRVGKNVVFNAPLYIEGDNHLVEIGDDCRIEGGIRIVRGDGGRILVGAGTTFNAVGISMHEAGDIIIGQDCLFSVDIHMDVSDMHPIYDGGTHERINHAKSIHIGDHVWIGRRTLILKGASIGSGSVVGAGSMVTGRIPDKVIAIGSPACVVRENIIWEREFGAPVVDRPFASSPDPSAVQDSGSGRRSWLGRLRRRP